MNSSPSTAYRNRSENVYVQLQDLKKEASALAIASCVDLIVTSIPDVLAIMLQKDSDWEVSWQVRTPDSAHDWLDIQSLGFTSEDGSDLADVLHDSQHGIEPKGAYLVDYALRGIEHGTGYGYPESMGVDRNTDELHRIELDIERARRAYEPYEEERRICEQLREKDRLREEARIVVDPSDSVFNAGTMAVVHNMAETMMSARRDYEAPKEPFEQEYHEMARSFASAMTYLSTPGVKLWPDNPREDCKSLSGSLHGISFGIIWRESTRIPGLGSWSFHS